MKECKPKILVLLVVVIGSLLVRCSAIPSEKQEKITKDSGAISNFPHSNCPDTLHYVSDFLDLCKEYLREYYLVYPKKVEIYEFYYDHPKRVRKPSHYFEPFEKYRKLGFIEIKEVQLLKDTIFATLYIGGETICFDEYYKSILFNSSEGRFILIIANIRTYEVYYLYDMNEQDDYSFNVDGYRHSYSDSLENAKKNFANNLLWLEGTSYTKDGYFELDDCSWRENLPEMEHYYYMNNPPSASVPSGLTVLGYELADLGNKNLKSFKGRFEWAAERDRGIVDPVELTKEQDEFFNKIHLEKRKIVEERKQKRKAKTDKIPKYFPRVRE
ncbi:MAG: hypothetical protein K1X92_15725 [Bacteroidia bacterium]|nr:hypothetical protein [Bacteroidia bacterium]